MPFPLAAVRPKSNPPLVIPPLALDHFTGSNGVNLTAHTMDIGAGWSAGAGTYTLNGSGKAVEAAYPAYITTNVVADVDVSVILTWSGTYSGLLVRNNAGTYYMLQMQVGNGSMNIYDSSPSLIANGNVTAPQSAESHTYRMLVVGKIIKVFQDGVCGCCMMRATANPTAIGCGLRAQGTFDDFTVVAGTLLPKIVFDGDSLTYGTGVVTVGNGGGMSYPEQVLVAYPTYGGINLGNPGDTTTQILARQATTNAYVSSGYKVCCVWAGTNDLIADTALATIEANLTSYWTAARSAGFKVVACTLPDSQYVSNPGDYQAHRATLNAWILTQGALWDAVADLGANATIGTNGAANNGTNFSTDKVHMLTPGYAVVSSLVGTAIGTLGVI